MNPTNSMMHSSKGVNNDPINNNLILVNINDIPNDFRESSFYQSMIDIYENVTSIHVKRGYDNFNQNVNNINDIKKLLEIYKYWMVSDNMFYDLVNNNKELIITNFEEFINITNNFEMQLSFITLLKTEENIYLEIITNNDISLCKYLCERQLINNNFDKHAKKRINFIRLLKSYDYNVNSKEILQYGIQTENIDYLEYLLEFYREYIEKNINKIVQICCLNQKNSWIIYFIKNNFNIDYTKLCYLAANYGNLEIFSKIVQDNHIESNTEIQIIDLFWESKESPNILKWLIENKMNLEYELQDGETILDGEYDDVDIALSYTAYGGNDDNFINDEYSDLSLSKFLQLTAITMNDKGIILMNLLLENGIILDSRILNRAAFWWSTENFIWLFNKGYSFDINTMEKAIRGGGDKTVEFLIEKGCVLNANYQSCEWAYSYSRYEMLQYLTSSKLNFNFDNRYIIRCVVDNNFELFECLYLNYPGIINHKFDCVLLNNRLQEFISICNPTKRQRKV